MNQDNDAEMADVAPIQPVTPQPMSVATPVVKSEFATPSKRPRMGDETEQKKESIFDPSGTTPIPVLDTNPFVVGRAGVAGPAGAVPNPLPPNVNLLDYANGVPPGALALPVANPNAEDLLPLNQYAAGDDRQLVNLVYTDARALVNTLKARLENARGHCENEKAALRAEIAALRVARDNQNREHAIEKSQWDFERTNLRDEIKRINERERKGVAEKKQAEKKCLEEKKELERKYQELKRCYVSSMILVLADYMSDTARNRLTGLGEGMSHEQLLEWDRRWKAIQRREDPGPEDMKTDELTYTALKERANYMRSVLDELRTRYDVLFHWSANVISQLKSIAPPDISELRAEDRLAHLARIETYQSFLAAFDRNLRDITERAQGARAVAVADFQIDDSRLIPADVRVGSVPWVKERTALNQQVDRLTAEVMRLREQLNDDAVTLVRYRTLIERVNGLWASLKAVVPPSQRTDIDELVALAVRNNRDKEQGLSSRYKDLEPLIGAENVKGIVTVREQLEKLGQQFRETKAMLEKSETARKALKDVQKENRQWRALCGEMTRWGSRLASYLWQTISGNMLTPESIVDHIRRTREKSQAQTQGQYLRLLWRFFVNSTNPNQQKASADVIQELDRILEEEEKEALAQNTLPEWIADFGPSAPVLGRPSNQPPVAQPTSGNLTFFEEVRDETWLAKLRQWEQAIETRVEVMDTTANTETKVPDQKQALGDEPPMYAARDIEDAEQKAQYDEQTRQYQRELARFESAFRLPNVEALDYAPALAEPLSIREARLRVYRAFACHLNWILWFANHTPSLESESKQGQDTTAKQLFDMGQTFEKQLTKVFRELRETERRRTDAVVTVMSNLADLVRVQFSAYWADRVLLEQTFRPDPESKQDTSTQLVLLETRRETMVRQAVDQLSAIWRDKNWSVEYPSKPLERYAESAWKELVKEWKEEVKETAKELKEQQKQLEEWATKAQNAASNLGISQNADAVSDQPKILDLINQCIKDERKELAEWDKAVRDLAKQWIKFSGDKPALRAQDDEVKYPALLRSNQQESSLPELVYRWFPRLQLLFQQYTEWSSKADQAFALADKNPFVGKAGSDVFVTVDVPAKLEVNMTHLLRRVAAQAQSMDLVRQLAMQQANRGGFGARAPITTASLGNGKTKGGPGGGGTTSVASVTSLSSRPRKELMEVDGERLQTFSLKNTRHSDLIEWKTPSQRVFDFFVLMAGKAAVDLSELVIPQYLEDQNGQSLHVIPIDPLSLVGSVTNGKTEAATVALATLTDTVTQANTELKKKANQTTYAVKRLAREWNTGQKETDPDPDAEPDEKHVTPSSALALPTLSSAELIDHEYSTVLTTNAYTAISASLAFLRNHHLHRDATLLGLASHRKYRQPFAEYCAAEYKFRQLQNLAIPSRDRSPQDRAVVNQALEAAKFRLLN